MIVCSCRNISTHHYNTEQELKDRILQDDFKCGLCQCKYLKEDMPGKYGGTCRSTKLEQGSNPNWALV